MSKPEKIRKKGGTPEEIMALAVKIVLGEKRSIRSVASELQINNSTLQSYVKKKKDADSQQKEIRFCPNYFARSVFTRAEEEDVTNYLKLSATVVYGLTSTETRRIVFQLAKRKCLEVPASWVENKTAGEHWLRSFVSRHHRNLRQSEACSLTRSSSFNPYHVKNFFNNYEIVREAFPSIAASQGQRIFNFDETETSTVQSTKKVAEIGCKQVYSSTSEERGAHITLCGIISAAGTYLPPAIIFPTVNFKPKMLVGTPPGTLGLTNKTGLMTEKLFLDVLDHFIKHSQSSKDNPSLLICDNHESHISIDVIDKARQNGVTLLIFPSHCSHKMQPLNVSIYGPLKKFYKAAGKSWTYKHRGNPMTIYDAGECIGEAFTKAFTPSNILSAFRKTGIEPFNRNIFTEEDFRSCTVIDRQLDVRLQQVLQEQDQQLEQDLQEQEQALELDLQEEEEEERPLKQELEEQEEPWDQETIQTSKEADYNQSEYEKDVFLQFEIQDKIKEEATFMSESSESLANESHCLNEISSHIQTNENELKKEQILFKLSTELHGIHSHEENIFRLLNELKTISTIEGIDTMVLPALNAIHSNEIEMLKFFKDNNFIKE